MGELNLDKSRGTVRVALVQMEVLRLNKKANQDRALDLIDRALGQRPDIIVLPETINLGFPCLPSEEALREYRDQAETLKGPFVEQLRRHAREKSVYIYAGLVEKGEDDPKRLYNTAVFAHPDGGLSVYRKVHLYQTDSYNERAFFEPGHELGIVDTRFARLGLHICYDTCFPEYARTLCFKGIDILVVGAAWPAAGGLRWDALVPARAVENQFYIIAVGQAAGPEGEFYGNSMAVDYAGRPLVRLGETEQIGFVEIEPDSIGAWRHQLPYLEQRRPDMYRLRE